MRNLIIEIVDRLSASYWFIPITLSVLAIIAAIFTLQLDIRYGDVLTEILEPLGLLNIQASDARSVLTVVASSMITVAGTVFSLTMVVLTLATQQYGPLVVSNFMRDRINQFSLGAFVATFIYCLILLLGGGTASTASVPAFSGLITVVLAMFNAFLLIYFIHHVSQSVQPNYIINSIASKLISALDEIFPARVGIDSREASNEITLPSDFEDMTRFYLMHSKQSGYLQFVDADEIIKLASENDLILKFDYRPGVYIIEGEILVWVYPKERVTGAVLDQLYQSISLGAERTLVQDSELMITQLEQIALRAISPAINDPNTASLCIDQLGTALAKLARKDQVPSAIRLGEDGHVRVVTDPLDFREFLGTAFDEIRHHGVNDPMIAAHLLHTLEKIVPSLSIDNERQYTYEYGATIWQLCNEAPLKAPDLKRVAERFEALGRALQDTPLLESAIR